MRSTNHHGRIFIAAALLALGGCAAVPPAVAPKAAPAETVAAPAEKPAAPVQVLPPQAQDAEVPFRSALYAMRENHLREAEQRLRYLTMRFPNLAGPYVNLGIIYEATDRPDEAVTAFEKAVELNPGNVDAYNRLAVALRTQGKFKAARDTYLRALVAQPKDATTHLNLGILYDLYLWQWDEALAQYQESQRLRQKPDKVVAGWISELKQRIEREGHQEAGR